MALVPYITVDGKEYPVANISYINGEVHAVGFHTDYEYRTYYSATNNAVYHEKQLKIDFSTALKFVDDEAISKEDKLFVHLDEMYLEEQQKLTEIAIDAMEDELIEPFATNLAERQKEYKLTKQRLLGMLDAIEEKKAFCEGYFERGE